MKKRYLFLASLLSLLVSQVSFAQSGTLFYEVTGKNLKKPSYILGTIHAICPGDMLPEPKLATYINQADQVVLELDLDDPAVLRSMAGGLMMTGGKTLKDFYTDAEYAKVDELLKSTVGVPVDAVKTFMPSMLAVMVVTNAKALGCTPASVDMLVVKAATTAKKPIGGLETAESQFAVLNSTPLEKQARDLYELAANPEKSIGEFKQMIGIYKSQDSEKLFEITEKQMSKDKAFGSKLLDDRNKAWIPQLEKSMSEGSVFTAVGAGHLGGKNGIVRLLKAKGYKLKPILL